MSFAKSLLMLGTFAAVGFAAMAQTTPGTTAPAPGMGPGMMHGQPYDHPHGMSPGAMGGMMGHGMMVGRALSSLNLSDSQRSQILKIQDDVRHQNWELMGKSQDEMAKLRDAYLAGSTANRKTILDTYKRIDELRLQRIGNVLDAQEKIENVLTVEQRGQLKSWGPWWAEDLGQ